MKIKLVYLITLLLTQSLFGQIRPQFKIYNLSLQDSTLNIMFHGRHNVLLINLPDDYKLSSNTASFASQCQFDSLYFVFPKSGTDKAVIYIVKLIDSDEFIVDSMIFRVLPTPDIRLLYGNCKSGYIEKKELITDDRVNLIYPDCFLKCLFSLRTMKIELISNGDTIQEYNDGWVLNERIRSKFTQLNSGDEINIYIRGLEYYIPSYILNYGDFHSPRYIEPLKLIIR
ncbi:MAG: hypothetical protein K9J13_00170 [Saprospiraceae bacterium]|nr:hypothetical protein [Saprospiraceae bacterium]